MPAYSTWAITSPETTRKLTVTNLTSISDLPLQNPTKLIIGRTLDTSGNPVIGATVLLFRQSDNFFIGAATTNATGHYAFPRDAADALTYYTVGYTLVGGVTQIHGTSNRNLVPG